MVDFAEPPKPRFQIIYTAIVMLHHDEMIDFICSAGLRTQDHLKLLNGNIRWQIKEECRRGEDSWVIFEHDDVFREHELRMFTEACAEMEKAFWLLKKRPKGT